MHGFRRMFAILVSLTGLGVCLWAVTGFFGTMSANALPWNDQPFRSEHYIAVGSAYSRAFVVGFFSCLFLVIGLSALRPHRSRKEDRKDAPFRSSAVNARRPG